MNGTSRVKPARAAGHRGPGTPSAAAVAAVVVAAVITTALGWPALATAGAVPTADRVAVGPPAVVAVPAGMLEPHVAVAPAGPYNPRLVTLWVTGTTSASVTWRRPKVARGITGYLVGMSVQYPDGNGGWGAWTGWKTKMFGASVRRVALTTVTPGLRIRVGVRTKYATGWGGMSIAYATLDSPTPTPTPTPEPTQSTPTPEPTQSTPTPEPTQSTSTPAPSQSTSTPTDCSQYPEGSLDWILCNHDPNS